ncbi:P-loop containing nucleoside triphosphate hydrolase protein [Kalaharituber pfeilii]|nr:P-loop containing nucleoside triphosphate hydrolase protein [Kalaharituber pfeilii]
MESYRGSQTAGTRSLKGSVWAHKDNEEIHPTSIVFDVFLRLRPPSHRCLGNPRFLSTIPTEPFHVYATQPPTISLLNFVTTGHRKNENLNESNTSQPAVPQVPTSRSSRTIEKFSFAEIFPEASTQLEVFERTVLPLLVDLVKGGNGPDGRTGKDGLLATLGITGSGKTHTILGSRTQLGMMQMSLEILFDALDGKIFGYNEMKEQLLASDNSEAIISNAHEFFQRTSTLMDAYLKKEAEIDVPTDPHISVLASTLKTLTHEKCAYGILVSMYEIYNDKIYDLLDDSLWEEGQKQLQKVKSVSRPQTPHKSQASFRSHTPYRAGQGPLPQTPQSQRIIHQLPGRPALSFKKCNVGDNRDKHVVLGLRKVYVHNVDEALLIIKHGQTCRQHSSTASNSTSSRSHAFFLIDVRRIYPMAQGLGVRMYGGQLAIADLAGAERMKLAKTKGERSVETSNINKSLMLLGQCMQLQAELRHRQGVTIPYRQSKLTEVLFANAFNSTAAQNGVMIICADPQGEYNSTMQILRYSALARELTKPRVFPSANSAVQTDQNPKSTPINEVIDNPIVKHLTDELKVFQDRYEDSERLRKAAEERYQELEMLFQETEQRVREEVTTECEQRMKEMQVQHSKNIWSEHQAASEFANQKIDIAVRALNLKHRDQLDAAEAGKFWHKYEELESENERLKKEIAWLRKQQAVIANAALVHAQAHSHMHARAYSESPKRVVVLSPKKM